MFAVSSMLLSETLDAMDDHTAGLDARYNEQINLLNTAFGVISAIFFVTGIIAIFVLDSLSDDPELYYRRR